MTIDTEQLKRVCAEALPLWFEEWDESTPVELAAVEAFSHAATPATVSELLTRIEVLDGERDTALRECVRSAREAGEAIGKLEASELAGIVDGWKERAFKAEAQIARVKAERERMRSALRKAAAWFRDYARQHRFKGTTEGNLKAQTNEDRADYLEAALQPRQGAPEEGL